MMCSALLLRVLAAAPPPCAGRAPRCGPRQRVPAIGRLMTRPSSSCTSASGDDPTSVASGWRRRYMYGDGLTWRSTRYTSNGSTSPSRSNRCARMISKMSPAKMCSRAASTASWNSRPAIVDVNAGSSSARRRAAATGRYGSGRASSSTRVVEPAPARGRRSSPASSPGARKTFSIKIQALAEVVERGDVAR